MAERAFLVSDLLDAITVQLDRVQDVMRLKAVNRPVTYALKDVSLDLKVFVEMDEQGQVRVRPSAPREEGASVVHLEFTSITRAMVDENTVSLSATRSPTLEEIGFDPSERARLERMGVRNAAELQRLHASTGTTGVSRLAGITVDRVRERLSVLRPAVNTVEPVSPTPNQPPPPKPPKDRTTLVKTPNLPVGGESPIERAPFAPPSPTPKPVEMMPPPERSVERADAAPKLNVAPSIVIPRDTVRLRLRGENLMGESGPPRARLGNRPLSIHAADDQEIVLELPPELESETLEVDLPDGQRLQFGLARAEIFEANEQPDPWLRRRSTPT